MQKASRPTSVPAPSDDEPNGRRTGSGRRSPLAAVPGDPGEIQRLETSQNVAGMAEQLRGVDPRAADRLDDLSAALASSDTSASWADVDLRRAFNTERLAYARAVEATGGPASRAIGVADRVRNVLVLVPILLTWFALAEASRAYSSYITENPDEVRKPFLLLWESGFGGHVGPFAPSFSKVALLDAILIAIIIALTLYAHGRREDHDDEIAASANAFQTDLDNVLADASVRLALDRGARPALLANSVERLAERFDRSSQELLTRLRLEHDRLEQISTRREKEFSDFGVFASGMRAGADETHRLLVELRQVSAGLRTSLEDLTAEVSTSTDQGRTLLVAIQGLERLTTSGIQSDQAVSRQMATAAELLAEAADKAVGGADAAAQAARLATDTTRGITDLAQSLVASQTRIEGSVAAEAEANARLADALRGSVNGVAASTRALTEITAGLAQLRDELGRLSLRTGEQASTLNALLDEQTGIAGGMAEVARDISSISIMTAQRQDTITKDVATLVGRLDALAATLARSAASIPSPEALERAFSGALRNELAIQADQIADTLGSARPAAKSDPARHWPQRRG